MRNRFLLSMLFVTCSVMTVFAQFSGSGSGTESDPYKIFDAYELNQVRNFCNQSGVVFKLMNDIDLEEWIADNNPGQGWEPIGNSSSKFKGTLEGNGKTLSGFSINRSSTDYVGLFGYVENATIKNLTIVGSLVSGNKYTGAFIGMGSGGTLTNLFYNGNVKSGSIYVGGIAGYYSGGTLSQAKVTGDVTGIGYCGGIVGFDGSSGSSTIINNAVMVGNVNGGSKGRTGGILGCGKTSFNSTSITTVKNSSFTGRVVSKGEFTGGIAGSCYILSDNIARGEVSGTTNVGGICGVLYEFSCERCYSYCDVTGTTDVGGVIGLYKTHPYYDSHGITDCFSFGKITGSSDVGGIVGYSIIDADDDLGEGSPDLSYPINVTNNVAIGNISASGNNVGGIVGYTYGRLINKAPHFFQIFDCYFNGSISASQYVGGVVGRIEGGQIERNYSNAIIEGSSMVGGIVGFVASHFVYGASRNYLIPTTVKSNMAINPSLSAASDVGRIYGKCGAKTLTSGSATLTAITIGNNGTASEDNRALYDTKIMISGVATTVEDNEQNGVNNGAAYFKKKANYVTHGWDFNSDWTNLDTESFPYKPWQAAPPTVTSELVSGDTSISGNSLSGGTVYVQIGNGSETSVACSGNSWTLSGISPLSSGETVTVYTKATGLQNSYRTQTKVGYPGSGTEADPWRVYTANDLQGVYKAGYYKQMNDINLTSWINVNSPSKGWLAVGYSGTAPIVYDGGNYKVTGLWTDTTEDYTGLFSNLPHATIRNLTVEASTKQVKGGNYTGILVGKITNGMLENVSVKGTAVYAGTTSSHVRLGGVAGMMGGMTINNVSFEGNVGTSSSATDNIYIGGLAGNAQSSNFTDCVVRNANIYSKSTNDDPEVSMGLLAGQVTGNQMSDCSVSGTLLCNTPACNLGGLAGVLYSKTVTKCKADVDITSSGVDTYAGGLAGQCGSTSVSLCVTTGTIKVTGADSEVGGLCGFNSTISTVENCYSTVVTEGTKYTAGLIGENSGKVNKCYASGNVTSQYNGAGLVTLNSGASAVVTNCVALNEKVNVSDQSSWSCRLIGNYNNGAPDPDESNYAWKNMMVSVNGVAKVVSDNILQGKSLNDTQIKQCDSYTAINWDFDEVWGISEGQGYPYLLAFGGQSTVTKGDLNGDGSVSITDVVLIIDVIAGTITDANQKAAADVNGDGSVSITDCVAAIDLIAAQQTNAARMRKAPALFNTTDNISACLQNGELVVSLDNTNHYTAFQMVICVPEGITLGKAVMNHVRLADHQILMRNLSNGQYLVAGFSLDNDELMGNSGHLFTIATGGNGKGNIVINNVEFATAKAETYHLGGSAVDSSTTGINDTLVNGESVKTEVYDLQGRRIKKPAKGLYIINGKKVNL